MRFKLLVVPILAVSLFAPVFPAFSQVAPAYSGPNLPLSVGIGPSGYDVDWGHGAMYGGTIWADWYPAQLPEILHGLGVEVEVRDISLRQNCNPPGFCPQKNLREDTAGGGVIYSWRHFRNFHPYAKFLIEDGSVDHYLVTPTPSVPRDQSHANLMLFAAGGGLEYRIYRPIWVRADYEYQDWGTLLGNTLNPQGITVGVSYDFSHAHSR
jgi:opacity protein-like surface antigen